MDDEYWRRYRRRARQRAVARMLLILPPIMMVVAFVSIVAPTELSAGDIRANPIFRLVAAGSFIVLALFLFVGSVRLLRRDPGDDGV